MTKSTWLRVGGVALACAGVALGVSGCEGSADASIAPSVTTTVAPAPTSSAHKPRDGVTGQISSENGTSWVVTTKKGKQITVTITSGTQFGNAAHPATEQQFTVGTTVRVVGAVSGDTVTATRIVVPQPKPNPSAAPTTTTGTPT